MTVRLEDIASITTGIYEKGSPSGDTYYLQAKHFDEYGKFRKDAILNQEIQMDGRLERHILEDGDLLIIAKGGSNRVCYYQSQIGQAVASSTFFVIRLKEHNILPKYLHWYFNTTRLQAAFSNLTKGTHILSLSKTALSKVKIELPSLKQQKEILELQALWDTERKITIQLLELKKSLYQNIQLKLANQNK